ncbi:hypothetical protein [Rhodanobacter sp. L36]|uniref:hypothetical protein n=1 Tax=Rhodanobacter sp. L36 TaxID=1747221 RepID=UPI00131D28AA|nr:hypothetical protein [Rhodanobacter sp. L36]
MSMLSALALATSVLAATAFYATSSNCLWPSMHRWRRWSMSLALLLCVLSIAAWINTFGIGVGLGAMLGTGMLTMIVLPWIALRTSSSKTSRKHD